MAMQLEEVVPFGRSLDEYRCMFALSDRDLQKTIIGVGDGPASFNAEMHLLGHPVISIDPVYQFTAHELERRFEQVLEDVIAQVAQHPENWVWSYHKSVDHLRENRRQAFAKFVQDYEFGKNAGRYRVEQLPNLNFENDQFELALCSHLLFLYSDLLDEDFHLHSILEMLRIAREVRIFPLLDLQQNTSCHLPTILTSLDNRHIDYQIETVPYELQIGGNQMLRIRA